MKNAEKFLYHTIPNIADSVLQILGTVLFLFAISGILAAALFACAPLLVWVTVIVQNRLSLSLAEMKRLETETLQMLFENLSSWETVRSEQAEELQSQLILDRLNGLAARGLGLAQLKARALALKGFINYGLITLCLLMLAYGTAFSQIGLSTALY